MLSTALATTLGIDHETVFVYVEQSGLSRRSAADTGTTDPEGFMVMELDEAMVAAVTRRHRRWVESREVYRRTPDEHRCDDFVPYLRES